MSEMAGGVLAGVTVTRKVLAFVAPAPSDTVKVTIAVPVWLGNGRTTSARAPPVPPNRRFASGNNDGLLERAVTTRRCAGVSASLTLKLNAELTPFFARVTSGICVIVGPSLTGFTVSRN